MALKPWDDRPHPKQGDKRASSTYEAVGRALTQWEYLEAKLAELFSQLVGGEWPSDGPPYHPADRAYGSVLGSAARLTMIEEAAKAHFQWYQNPVLEKRLKDLKPVYFPREIRSEILPSGDFLGQSAAKWAYGVIESMRKIFKRVE
jgi:hypothetical protein